MCFLGASYISSNQVNAAIMDFQTQIQGPRMLLLHEPSFIHVSTIQCSSKSIVPRPSSSNSIQKSRESVKKPGKREHHLWKRRDSAGSGQQAMNLVRTISGLPNEKEAVYRALDEWSAWELEFPLIATAKALTILKKQRQWMRVIQVAKWMLSKGQGTTMATYDTVLLAFDQEKRIDEAGSLWNMILHTHTRSISKRLFSRMISLYDHHSLPEKVIEVFTDMEELGVKPDEDTVKRVARAFEKLGQEDKKDLVIQKYGCKWKYIHFKGERVKVKRHPFVD
ncbi:hypothetical protein BVRB_8g200950 [Beta vulgaris subsp. vulgaris]|uniref:Pentatricopeptide repeat-containing protein n=2 Tax=Beta vulgaris subsp. vulgaris TaxID=3555 RepID=A0A0J8E0P2_BETVV|nr:hypothetical protein BVRB_8g200950 [Beta vulgaris subsp. vulgaris]